MSKIEQIGKNIIKIKFLAHNTWVKMCVKFKIGIPTTLHQLSILHQKAHCYHNFHGMRLNSLTWPDINLAYQCQKFLTLAINSLKIKWDNVKVRLFSLKKSETTSKWGYLASKKVRQSNAANFRWSTQSHFFLRLNSLTLT